MNTRRLAPRPPERHDRRTAMITDGLAAARDAFARQGWRQAYAGDLELPPDAAGVFGQLARNRPSMPAASRMPKIRHHRSECFPTDTHGISACRQIRRDRKRRWALRERHGTLATALTLGVRWGVCHLLMHSGRAAVWPASPPGLPAAAWQ